MKPFILNYIDIKTISKSFRIFNYILIKIQLTLIKYNVIILDHKSAFYFII